MRPKIFYKNKLPHIAPIGATFFVTFRLADSLPLPVVVKLKEEMDDYIIILNREKPDNYKLLVEKEKQKFFEKYDAQLDLNPYGECHLKDPVIANIVKTKLHELDRKAYDLICYCIMPNHVHVLFDTSCQLIIDERSGQVEMPENYKQLHDIMKLIKGNTAYYSNLHLERKGKFWQRDSFDRFMRDDDELYNTVNYIIQNPAKAGLVQNWNDWPHTYLHSDFIQ